MSDSRAVGGQLFSQPASELGSPHARDARGSVQAQSFGGYGSQDGNLACRLRRPTLGTQHPAQPAGSTPELMIAANIIGILDDALAAARHAVPRGVRSQRGFASPYVTSAMSSNLSFVRSLIPIHSYDVRPNLSAILVRVTPATIAQVFRPMLIGIESRIISSVARHCRGCRAGKVPYARVAGSCRADPN